MRTTCLRALFALMAIFALLGCQAPLPQQSARVSAPATALPEPDYWPTAAWQASAPEQQGMDSARLVAMFDAIDREQIDLHSLLIVRNGYVVTEAYFAPYGPAVKQQVASVTKSVTGMLVGIAMNQGLITSTGQSMLEFFPGRTVANLDENKRGVTLEHLLTMTSGLDCSDAAGDRDRMFQSSDWVQFALDLPMSAAPGSQFTYCSPAANLLSPILSRATGKSIRELANETLFAPLGIPPAGPDDWASDPRGISQGFSGLTLTPRDMARLGFLYLHAGRWGSQQVVPADWVAKSAAPRAAVEAGRGYGYLLWVDEERAYYSALGLGGQDIHILPAENLVVVFTAAVDGATHDHAVMRLLDDYIIPSMVSAQPVPANPAAQAQLQARIDRAAAPQVPPAAPPALARSISGRVYDLDPNANGWTTLSLSFPEGSPEASVTVNGALTLPIGLDNVYRTTDSGNGALEAMRGHWEGDSTFVIDHHFLGEFMQWRHRVSFQGDQMLIDLGEQVTGAAGTVRGHLAP